MAAARRAPRRPELEPDGELPRPRDPRNDPAEAQRGALHRRQLLAAGGLCLASCATPRAQLRRAEQGAALERLFDAHALQLPERAGAGANHYPMAAEALEALGHADQIDAAWVEGAALYEGELGRRGALSTAAAQAAALGDYRRYGDWLDHFRGELAHRPWSQVLGQWAPRLAPGLMAGAYHGLIRTGHATRALGLGDNAPRRGELAAGLAYWAARYVELPDAPATPDGGRDLLHTLASLEHPWLGDTSDVDFSSVTVRMLARPVAPALRAVPAGTPPMRALEEIVHAAAIGFLEMLVAERQRIWVLHTVTGPAALQWILPHVPGEGAALLVAHARRSVIAMYAAYGEPFTPLAHLHADAADWPVQIQRAVDSRSVHGIKLIDALVRFQREDQPVWRSLAAQWFLWT